MAVNIWISIKGLISAIVSADVTNLICESAKARSSSICNNGEEKPQIVLYVQGREVPRDHPEPCVFPHYEVRRTLLSKEKIRAFFFPSPGFALKDYPVLKSGYLSLFLSL